ncbi:hypothetical protein N7488_008122 [Penicillium malachiteum]|nr:hypothetical protein N7488_008122 [Penicillium malachiteum]
MAAPVPPPAFKWNVKPEHDGWRYQCWIDGLNPGAVCPVQPHDLAFEVLNIEEKTFDDDLGVDPVSEVYVPELYLQMFRAFGVTDYTSDRGHRVMSYDAPDVLFPDAAAAAAAGEFNQAFALGWAGCVTDQFIILEILRHHTGKPFMSDVTNAVYHNFYPDDDPEFIIVHFIINEDFLDVLNYQIYILENGIDTAGLRLPVLEWEYNTPEYMALLGTPIGKVVAAFVLGRYQTGAVRIKSIAIHISMLHAGDIHAADAKFNFETITPAAKDPIEEEGGDEGEGKRKRKRDDEEEEAEAEAGPAPKGGEPAAKRPRGPGHNRGPGSRRDAIASRAKAVRMSLPKRNTRSGKDYNPDA